MTTNPTPVKRIADKKRSTGKEYICCICGLKIEDKDKRIEKFINKLVSEVDLEFSFEENLKRYASKNKINDNVMDHVYQSLEY
jgi:hypothetical protein